jgi:hypothetical protein
MLWRHRNKELHGDDGEISQEAKRKAALAQVRDANTDTVGQVSPQAGLILHWCNINTMLNWTKQQLDAYLAMAEVACEWNVEPG